MVEKASRSAVSAGPRSADGCRFEVFVRDDESDPLSHVGTVSAPSPDAAHEEASKLFAWYARDVWVCPTAETHRYTTERLADEHEPDGESVDATQTADEPRVYEETEGTPAASGDDAT